jgi:hypothetical protein
MCLTSYPKKPEKSILHLHFLEYLLPHTTPGADLSDCPALVETAESALVNFSRRFIYNMNNKST